MDPVTLWMVLVVVGLTAATLLLTGPGLWSEKWGWRWFERRRSRRGHDDPGDRGPR